MTLLPPIQYAVIGGHQCGTSVLWSYGRMNERLAFVGHFRNEHFSHSPGKSALCDNSVEEYLDLVTVQLRARNRSDLLVGDWGSMNLHCLCCPASLRMLNPQLKVVVVLRDPVQRALSTFLAARRLRRHSWNDWTMNYTFAGYVERELESLGACIARARRFTNSSSSSSNSGGVALAQQQQQQLSSSVASLTAGGAAVEGLRGWGAGLDMGQWMEAQCWAHSHILGWSAYDVFLSNYLAHFQPRQLLVLYASELAAQPAAVMARLEAHLGAPPARQRYDGLRLTPAVMAGVGECNGVRCLQTASAHLLASLAPGEQPPLQPHYLHQHQHQGLQAAAAGAGTGGGVGNATAAAPPPIDPASPFARAVAALAEFYAPHVARLVRWGEEGRISPPPAEWREAYGIKGTA